MLPDLAEPFSDEDLQNAWNEYALNIKRDKKDSLYATLTGSKPIVNSTFQISLKISNNAQERDLEREKVNLLAYLRSKLKNYQISFVYHVSASKVTTIDSKSNFEKLTEENPSLEKFRKLFNLDIDY